MLVLIMKEIYFIKYFLKKYGIPAQPTDNRMTGERCAELCAVAIANRCRECWMGPFPFMFSCYFIVYFPLIYNM